MLTLIATSNSKPGALDKCAMLIAYLNAQGVKTQTVNVDTLIWENPYSKENVPECVKNDEVDLVITLGGDGTILRTARILEGKSVPILGINLGKLGFLANDINDDLIELTSMALAGELIEEKRTNILCDIICKGEHDWVLEGGEKPRPSLFALNEVAITRGEAGIMLEILLDISGAAVGKFKGDGMIVSSATGSTAYCLAAGGPIVAPSFHGLIVQPLASHTISARTILTNENDVVQVTIANEPGDTVKRIPSVYADGMDANLPEEAAVVYVRRGSVPTTLLYKEANSTIKKATQTFFRGL
ncbi:MAG: NAD(+)/NADH kinase [Phoenicibacter congonensis]|uniref:NAD kinase n=1 Tax=Phoenicibacter congonensis TaxID=1944646 RepID=A0AA43RIS9_9ACTN|nr:NAD(+)/NADH kinase [Phoenicibacter congonensis]